MVALAVALLVAAAHAGATASTSVRLRVAVIMPGGLVPGSSGPLTLTVTDPSSTASVLHTLRFAGLTTHREGCADAWFVLSDTLRLPVRIPANSSVHVSVGRVRFVNAPVNQDACPRARITLTVETS
ncbi:MAG TPA: hypothetical protein VG325_18045 [Solirubrobacteraceae bacterium]|nr:hypothetical protein [Solirubrobacteraceae bacterium]